MAKRKMTSKYRSKADAKRDAKRRKAKKKKHSKGEVEAIETVFLASKAERVVFWLVMITLFFSMLTHVSLLFHEVMLVPRQYDQDGWAKFGERIERMAHFYSVLAFGGVLVLVFLIWLPRSIVWRSHDFEWLSRLGGYGRKWAKIPPAGRFNPEEKIATLGLLLFGALYVLSGIVQERPDLVAGNVMLVRTAYSLHAFCLVALGFISLMHIYLAGFARPGGMGAIWSGRVPKKFAETHYGVWIEMSQSSLKLKDEKERQRHEKYVDMEKHRIAEVMAKRKAKMKSKASKGKAAKEEAVETEVVAGAEVEMEIEIEPEVEEIEVEEGEIEEGEYEEGEYEEGEYEEGEYEEGEEEYEYEEVEEGEEEYEEEYDEEAFKEEVSESGAFELEAVEGEEEEGE